MSEGESGPERTKAVLGALNQVTTAFGNIADRLRFDNALSEAMRLLKERSEHRMDDREEEFAAARSILIGSPLLAQDARAFLTRHRTLQQFWDRAASRYTHYRERREIVDLAFESTLARMEHGEPTSLVELDEDVLHDLDMSEALRLWEKAKNRLEGDADGALTLTRTLLETVCKKILDAFGEAYGGGDTAQNLCRRALSLVLPIEVAGREHFRQFTRSVLNIVEHISLYRAEESDAHGSAALRAIERFEAAYAVDLAGSTSLFLIECYRATRA
mgnify:CR=1 FL=1